MKLPDNTQAQLLTGAFWRPAANPDSSVLTAQNLLAPKQLPGEPLQLSRDPISMMRAMLQPMLEAMGLVAPQQTQPGLTNELMSSLLPISQPDSTPFLPNFGVSSPSGQPPVKTRDELLSQVRGSFNSPELGNAAADLLGQAIETSLNPSPQSPTLSVIEARLATLHAQDGSLEPRLPDGQSPTMVDFQRTTRATAVSQLNQQLAGLPPGSPGTEALKKQIESQQAEISRLGKDLYFGSLMASTQFPGQRITFGEPNPATPLSNLPLEMDPTSSLPPAPTRTEVSDFAREQAQTIGSKFSNPQLGQQAADLVNELANQIDNGQEHSPQAQAIQARLGGLEVVDHGGPLPSGQPSLFLPLFIRTARMELEQDRSGRENIGGTAYLPGDVLEFQQLDSRLAQEQAKADASGIATTTGSPTLNKPLPPDLIRQLPPQLFSGQIGQNLGQPPVPTRQEVSGFARDQAQTIGSKFSNPQLGQQAADLVNELANQIDNGQEHSQLTQAIQARLGGLEVADHGGPLPSGQPSLFLPLFIRTARMELEQDRSGRENIGGTAYLPGDVLEFQQLDSRLAQEQAKADARGVDSAPIQLPRQNAPLAPDNILSLLGLRSSPQQVLGQLPVETTPSGAQPQVPTLTLGQPLTPIPDAPIMGGKTETRTSAEGTTLYYQGQDGHFHSKFTPSDPHQATVTLQLLTQAEAKAPNPETDRLKAGLVADGTMTQAEADALFSEGPTNVLPPDVEASLLS